MKSLIGAFVAVGGLDAFDEDTDELVALLEDRGEACFGAKGLSFDDFEPNESLAEFFEADFHFVNEVSSRFCTLCLAVVWCGSCARADELTRDVSACFGVWQRFHDIDGADGEIHEAIFECGGLLVHDGDEASFVGLKKSKISNPCSSIVNGLGVAVALDGLTSDEQSIFDF